MGLVKLINNMFHESLNIQLNSLDENCHTYKGCKIDSDSMGILTINFFLFNAYTLSLNY
jgi:hypothetical protein